MQKVRLATSMNNLEYYTGSKDENSGPLIRESNSGGNGSNSTDAIIEELKSLAKSMLDATNTARRRANSMESKHSYEALMRTIESQTFNASQLLKSNSSIQAIPFRGPHDSDPSQPATEEKLQMASQTLPNGTKEEMLSSAANDAKRATLFSEEDSSSCGFANDEMNTVHADSTAVSNLLQRKKHATEELIGSHPRISKKGALTDESGIVEDHEEVAHTHLSISKEIKDIPISLEESKDTGLGNYDSDEENVFDGVKTQVYFRSADKKAYKAIAASTWKPEPLRRSTSGQVTVDDPSDREQSYIDEEDSDGAGRLDSASDADKIHKSSHGKSSSLTRVFRLPLFPYGGGVTRAQWRELDDMLTEKISTGVSTHTYQSKYPQFVSKAQFINREYREIPSSLQTMSKFQPQSPLEFVVEVERDVIFDAFHARESRRKEFRRLARENKAPSTMGSFNLRVIMDPIKTGFEEEKNFPIIRGTIVADRYQIIDLLGKATFSRAVRCYDLHQPIYDDEGDDQDEGGANALGLEHNNLDTASSPSPDRDLNGKGEFNRSKTKKRRPIGYVEVCLKIINNTKDFFDQSLDEIRLLTLINAYKDPDEAHVVRLIDSFYYKEHTMLVTELLSDNLYEYSKYIREEGEPAYFTLPRLRSIARQITEALAYVHSLNLIHTDLKPENILFVSHRRCIVKVIDFGSSCFLSDHLSSYIQSRSYRAPEVVLGCDYDGRIDIWSLGAILVELATGDVLFTSETVPEMLARMVYVCGLPFPRRMLWEGRYTSNFINKFGCIYEQGNKEGDEGGEDCYYLYTPVHDKNNPALLSSPPSAPAPSTPAITAAPENAASLTAPTHSTITNSTGERKIDEVNKVEDGLHTQSYSNGTDMPAPYSVLRRKLSEHGITDTLFLSFVESCLTLDHKKRPTSKELLSHPFLATN